MKKGTIVAIVGASGSGKTQLSLFLHNHGYPVICSYTTRPMRPDETNGVEHIFVTEDSMPSKDEMLAYTYFGGYHYWAKLSQVHDKIPTIYVIDEKGLIDLKDRWGDLYDIVCVYIKRTNIDVDNNRMLRDNERVALEPNDIDIEIINNYGSLDDFLDNEGIRLINKLDSIK